MKFCFQWCTVLLCCFLSACANNLSSSSYTGQQVNTASRVAYGTIIQKRTVTINNSTGVGGLAGAAAGGVAGSAIGGSSRANIVSGIGGALVGGLLGHAVEKGIRTQQGYAYIIRTNRSGTISVTQTKDNNLPVGMRVMVVYGKQVRVVPAN